MGKNIGKKINRNLIGKYSQKFIDHVKRSAIDAFKATSRRMIRETAERTKVANRITKTSKNSQQKRSEIATNEYNKEIPKEIYIYVFRRETENFWKSEINQIV